jgi:hypothetical protein
MENQHEKVKKQLTIEEVTKDIEFINEQYWDFGQMTKDQYDTWINGLQEVKQLLLNNETLYYYQ